MILLRLPLIFARLMVQSILLALGQIWANKVRSTLTAIGIIIGVASVTTVIAVVISAISRSANSNPMTFGTGMNMIPLQPPVSPFRSRSSPA